MGIGLGGNIAYLLLMGSSWVAHSYLLYCTVPMLCHE